MKFLINAFVISNLLLVGGCSSAFNVDMSSKKSSASPVIYSRTFHILGSKRIITKVVNGDIVRINKKQTNPLNPHQFIVDPGTYEVEMTWSSSIPPVDSMNVNSSTTFQPMGFIVVKGSLFKPKNAFTTRLIVREGYSYFVNLEESIVDNNNAFKLPTRLCISEVKQNSDAIRTAPAGHVILNRPVKTIVCSN